MASTDSKEVEMGDEVNALEAIGVIRDNILERLSVVPVQKDPLNIAKSTLIEETGEADSQAFNIIESISSVKDIEDFIDEDTVRRSGKLFEFIRFPPHQSLPVVMEWSASF